MMDLDFKLRLNPSGNYMSDRSIELAAQVNDREARESRKEALQLHRHQMLQAKGRIYWQKFTSIAQDEVEDFNRELKSPEHRVTLDTSESYVLRFSGSADVVGSIVCNLSAHVMSVSCGPVPPRSIALSDAFDLTVDYNDRIRLKAENEKPVAPSDLIINLLRYMTGL